MKREFITLQDGQQLHLLIAGKGPAVVLLHETPYSARMLTEFADELSRRFLTVAFDMPGYGGSDCLEGAPSINGLAAQVLEGIDALQLERFLLYGVGAGAVVALEVARLAHDRVAALALDDLPWMSESEAHQARRRAFPAYAPRWDGSHLMAMWSRVRDEYIFDPWFERTPHRRTNRDIPQTAILHERLVDFLLAGAKYAEAPKAALEYPFEKALPLTKVPTRLAYRNPRRAVFAREQLGKDASRFIADEAPIDEKRHAAATGDFLATHLDKAAPMPAISQTGLPEGQIGRRYVTTSSGAMLVRESNRGLGRPLIMLHASPGSSVALLPLMHELALSRHVVSLDLPGNGGSDALRAQTPTATDYAKVLLEAVTCLGITEADFFGTHTGAMLSTEIAVQRPHLVRNLVLDGVTLFSAKERSKIVDSYVEPFTLSWDGAHLIWAWAFRRDGKLFWPWHNRTRSGVKHGHVWTPKELHQDVVDFLRTGETFGRAYSAALTYPTRERLSALQVRTLVCARTDDPLYAYLQLAHELVRGSVMRICPKPVAKAGKMIDSFLGGSTQTMTPTEGA